jgi:dynein heavy chain
VVQPNGGNTENICASVNLSGSNGNNPPKIIPHIGDIFEGINSLDLVYSETQVALQASTTSDDDLIQAGYLGCPEAAEAMVAKDGERVRFNQQFLMRGAVENWLNELVSCMHSTLQIVLSQALTDAASWEVDKSREEWVFDFPAQIVLLASQILWTEETEAALEELEAGQEGALRQYRDSCAARLDALIRVVQGELTRSDRLKIITVRCGGRNAVC